jgi:hypothetical protein
MSAKTNCSLSTRLERILTRADAAHLAAASIEAKPWEKVALTQILDDLHTDLAAAIDALASGRNAPGKKKQRAGSKSKSGKQ